MVMMGRGGRERGGACTDRIIHSAPVSSENQDQVQPPSWSFEIRI